MIANVNGIHLYYEKTGSGRPLVMVHGNGEDHTIFDAAVGLLKDRFTCYCVDSRGHGGSSPAYVLHYEEMADDMIAFLEELDLRDVVFYGFSDGGIIGLLAASRCGRITALITSGANLTPEGCIRPLRMLFAVMYFLKKDPKTALMMTEPQISEDVLGKIGAKTLVLAGSHDLVTEEETRRIAAGIPGAKLVILRGEGHGSYIVHKEKIAKILLAFLPEDAGSRGETPRGLTGKERKTLRKAQQGELDAVLMYRALADTVKDEEDAAVFRRLAAEEGRHAAVFRDLTGETLQPKKTKAVLLPLLYRLIGRRKLYPLIARGEYAAVKSYRGLIWRFPEARSVRRDEKRHGDTVIALL